MPLSLAALACAAGCVPPASSASSVSGEETLLPPGAGETALPLLRDGDLVVRRGRGLFSDLFRTVGGSEAPYSHVGIVHLGRGTARVIHTEASELTGRGHARVEPLDSFIAAERADAAALYRPVGVPPGALEGAVAAALEMAEARTPFDTAFDLETENRLYCTELVWLAFRRAGLPLVEEDQLVPLSLTGRTAPLRVLTMESLLRSEHIQLIWTQETRIQD
jgi:hypothetical protein